ncbi:MAG: hypothetical protein ABI240_11930, partial [Sphingomonas sp.]
IVNIGSGEEVSIRVLARMIADIVGFEGDLTFDASKPDGTMRKLLDTGRLHGLGWASPRALRDGVGETYTWFLDNIANTGSAGRQAQASGAFKPRGTA